MFIEENNKTNKPTNTESLRFWKIQTGICCDDNKSKCLD